LRHGSGIARTGVACGRLRRRRNRHQHQRCEE
jgi:hypothetical protein